MVEFTCIRTAGRQILRLDNVPPTATEDDIRQFFEGYPILDQIRAIDPRTGSNSSVYVMLSIVQDMQLDSYILGRRIHIEAAPSGNYVGKSYILESLISVC
jgi:hypothetical protein